MEFFSQFSIQMIMLVMRAMVGWINASENMEKETAATELAIKLPFYPISITLVLKLIQLFLYDFPVLLNNDDANEAKLHLMIK